MDVTNAELLAFIDGNADVETKRRIADEMQVQGSYVDQWIRRLQSGMDDLLNVDWPCLLDDESAEDGESVNQTQGYGEANA